MGRGAAIHGSQPSRPLLREGKVCLNVLFGGAERTFVKQKFRRMRTSHGLGKEQAAERGRSSESRAVSPVGPHNRSGRMPTRQHVATKLRWEIRRQSLSVCINQADQLGAGRLRSASFSADDRACHRTFRRLTCRPKVVAVSSPPKGAGGSASDLGAQ